MTPYYSDDLVTIYHGDCREWMPDADVIVTDPPYGVGMDDFADDLATAIAALNAAPGLSLIAFMSPRQVIAFANGLDSWIFGRMLWWHKSADIGWPWRRWFMNSEAIVTAQRLGGAWNAAAAPVADTYITGPQRDRPRHPAGKPESVVRSLVDHTTGTVLDPFVGSGSTLVAAKSLGRRAIGIEIEERYCEIAATRCSQEVLGLAV